MNLDKYILEEETTESYALVNPDNVNELRAMLRLAGYTRSNNKSEMYDPKGSLGLWKSSDRNSKNMVFAQWEAERFLGLK